MVLAVIDVVRAALLLLSLILGGCADLAAAHGPVAVMPERSGGGGGGASGGGGMM